MMTDGVVPAFTVQVTVELFTNCVEAIGLRYACKTEMFKVYST